MAAKTTKTQKQNELVIVIAGKEQTLVNDKCTEIVDKLLPPEERTTGLWVTDADKVTVSEVLDEIRTLPFLTKRRVVVLRNATRFLSSGGEKHEDGKQAQSSNREILEKYFESPCPTGILIITVSSWDTRTRLAKKLPAIGKLIEVESPKAPELKRLLIAYAQDTYGKRLDYGTADLLVETSGDDITRLKTEIDKLATYAADEKAITAEHVEALVGYNRMYNAFAVIDACLAKKPAEAVKQLRKMFAEDKNADYTTVGAFAYHFRNLFTAKKLIQEGYNEYEAAGRARIFYNKESKLAQLRRLSIKQIGDQLKGLAEIDYAIKRGQAQPRIAIEQFVLKMAAL
ncbi:MAG: DNA polymerase III subunit delta [Sedimentisphaerales bacterium]|nr:DNA polymerase III subunit delta [Sedimentisphaerales bacterium]